VSSRTDPLARFLEQLKAEARSEHIEEYSELLIWSSRCREILTGLREEGFDYTEELHIPVPAPAQEERIAAVLRPDFVTTRDGVRLLIFLDMKSETGKAPTSALRQYHHALINSSISSAAVHTWRGDDLPSAVLDMYKMSRIDFSGKQQISLEPIKPLRSSILEFYHTSFVGDWALEELETLRAEKSTTDTLAVLEQSLRRQFQQFKQRELRRWNRKEAQALIDDQIIGELLEILKRSIAMGRREDIQKVILRLIQEKSKHD
jgi:hypothetical protein